MTVTTIDFDIIMAPAIESYNDLISEEQGMTQLCKQYPYFNYAEADLYIYEYLTRFLIAISKKIDANKIYFISNHELAYEILINLKEPFELINIDHHHDINYFDEWDKPIIMPDDGNWVKALFDRNKITKYTWIGNPNSNIYNIEKCPFEDQIYRYQLDEFPMGDLENETDMVICCFSEDYIPTIYQPLFLCWRAIIEEQFNKDYLILNSIEEIEDEYTDN